MNKVQALAALKRIIKEPGIADQYTEEEGWEIMAVGDKNLVIKTSTLEENAQLVLFFSFSTIFKVFVSLRPI